MTRAGDAVNMEKLEAKYVTTVKMFGKPILKHHLSLAEVIEWARFNALAVGEPREYAPLFAIEHADGSSITPEERKRLVDALGEHSPNHVFLGEAHALTCRVIQGLKAR